MGRQKMIYLANIMNQIHQFQLTNLSLIKRTKDKKEYILTSFFNSPFSFHPNMEKKDITLKFIFTWYEIYKRQTNNPYLYFNWTLSPDLMRTHVMKYKKLW